MKISRSNYESYFLDFLEGNLDPFIMDEFQAFLGENPDLALELQTGDFITLRGNDVIRFDAKEELKKSEIIEEVELQELFVAYCEGDLSLSERGDFEESLSENSSFANEVQKFGKLKLEPDRTIVYRNKVQLKKPVIPLPLWIKVVSAAAILLLAYLVFPPHDDLHSKSQQMSGNLSGTSVNNRLAPEQDLKSQEQDKGKATPAVASKPNPAILPVRQKQNTGDQKPVKKITPVPSIHVPETAPVLLKPRVITFGQRDDIELAVMTFSDTTALIKDIELAELLKVQLERMRNSDDRELLSTEHLGLSGLELFARLTGKRLTARKGKDGTVHSVSYNSRLLAFSIPVNR
jgi:hypothetical protein